MSERVCIECGGSVTRKRNGFWWCRTHGYKLWGETATPSMLKTNYGGETGKWGNDHS